MRKPSPFQTTAGAAAVILAAASGAYLMPDAARAQPSQSAVTLTPAQIARESAAIAALTAHAAQQALLVAKPFDGLPQALDVAESDALEGDEAETEAPEIEADDQGEDADDQGEDADDQGEHADDQGEHADHQGEHADEDADEDSDEAEDAEEAEAPEPAEDDSEEDED